MVRTRQIVRKQIVYSILFLQTIPLAPIDSKGKQRVILLVDLESTIRLHLGQSNRLIAPQFEKSLTVELLVGTHSVNQALRNLDGQSSSKDRYATTCADTANGKTIREVFGRSIGFLNADLDRGVGKHDSFCGSPPPATAPNLILETHCLTSDRVPHHIKPRGPGHFIQPYGMRHRLNKTGLSTVKPHLATTLVVISPEPLFGSGSGTGSYGCCRVWVFENRYAKGASCILGSNEKSRRRRRCH